MPRIPGGLARGRHAVRDERLCQTGRSGEQPLALVGWNSAHTPLEQLPDHAKREVLLELASKGGQRFDACGARLLLSGPQKRRLADARRSLDEEHDALGA